MADCVVVTAAAVTSNQVLVEFAGTVTEAGTVADLLLLDNVTFSPALGAAELSVTVQGSVSAPVIDQLWQVTELTVGVAPSNAAGSEQDSAIRPAARKRFKP